MRCTPLDGIDVPMAVLGERLLVEINAQLDARGLILRRGTLIDASIVKSAARLPSGEVSARDPDAGFTRKHGKTSFGYKAHIGTEEGSGLIRQAVMTTASIHDNQACDVLVQGDEAAVHADKAYDDSKRRDRFKAQGIEPRILYKARRNKPLTVNRHGTGTPYLEWAPWAGRKSGGGFERIVWRSHVR